MSPIIRSVLLWNRCPFPKKRRDFDLSLYLVANRPSFPNKNLFFEKIKDAVRGGVSCVQLRDHKSDLGTAIETARRLKEMLKGVPLFINTLAPFEVVRAVDAEGVYLEESFPYVEARRLLGEKAIIGVPVKTIGEVLELGTTEDVDYISVKVSRSNKTCPRNDQLWEMEGLRKVRALSPHRIVAIGGLTPSCVEAVYRELRGDDGVAMAGGLMGEENPGETAAKIEAIRQKVRGER